MADTDLVTGREPVAPSWSTAMPDWRKRILAGESLVPPWLPLFREEAQRALRVFKRLRIPDVHGCPTMAEACGPWFFPIVAAMFGSYDPETHRRMIQEFMLLLPKKNSKSSNGGAVMLTAAIMNRRPEGEFNFIAPTIQVASIAYKQATGTIKLDPELDKVFQCRDHVRAIQHRVNGTTLQIKAADTDVVTGGKPVGTMIDETHVFAKRSNAADIFVELRGALAARPDGFLFQTTTQSKDAPAGVFLQELKTARAVRDGEMALPLLPILYELPEELVACGAWRERRYWSVVNPNLGRSVDESFLERELRKAEQGGREQMALIASQHFNVEIGLRLRADRWPGADHWLAAAEPGLTLKALLERSEVVVVGLDGGGLDDLFGLCVIGRCRATRRWLAWTRAWGQLSVLNRREIAPTLEGFVADGDLVICGEVARDVLEIADLIESIADTGLLPEKRAIGIDPMAIAAVTDELEARNLGGERIAAIPQGFRLSGAIWGAERKLADGTLRHAGQPMMAWCVGNAKAEQRGNAVIIEKAASGKAKIDPLIALFNGFSLMSRSPVAEGQSVYLERGLLTV